MSKTREELQQEMRSRIEAGEMFVSSSEGEEALVEMMLASDGVSNPKVGQQYYLHHEDKYLNVEVRAIYEDGRICVCEIGPYHVLTPAEFKVASDPKAVFLG